MRRGAPIRGRSSSNRRSDDTANGCAFLPRLAGHFASDFFDEEVKFRRARDRVRSQDRRIQGVCLCSESDRFADDFRVLLQKFRRIFRARKRNAVLTIQMFEQIADAATN